MLTLESILRTTKQMTSYREGPQFPKSAATKEEYDARPLVCEWCGYRVKYPCENRGDRLNCDNY